MSQKTSRRPSTRRAPAAPAVSGLDRFLNREKEETVRLNVEIPRTLRARVKACCALEGREIKDVVIELLQQRFPA